MKTTPLQQPSGIRSTGTASLVTFCGMVGSGKTTNSKKTLRWLCHAGHEPYYLRFRFLNWRSLWRTPAPKPWQETQRTQPRAEPRPLERTPSVRRLETDKTLTLPLCLGYMLRALRFRLFRRMHHRDHVIVMNRYFYDNLAHYRLVTPREQRYLRWLQAAIPRPDLVILLVLRPETAQRRRPAYVLEDLRRLAQNFAHLRRLIPGLKIVPTDNVGAVNRHVERYLQQVFQKQGKRGHVQESYPQN